MYTHLSKREIAMIDLEILVLSIYRAPHHDGERGVHDLEQRNVCVVDADKHIRVIYPVRFREKLTH